MPEHPPQPGMGYEMHEMRREVQEVKADIADVKNDVSEIKGDLKILVTGQEEWNRLKDGKDGVPPIAVRLDRVERFQQAILWIAGVAITTSVGSILVSVIPAIAKVLAAKP